MKTALVTGASSGIGKETVKRLLRDGFAVFGAARRVEQMRDLEELGARTVKLDVTKDDEVAGAVGQIARERGGIDVLINNAGFGLYGAVEDTSLEDARYQFEVNLFGVARLTRAVLPFMRAKRAGKIVNISSMGGKIYMPLGAWYHATKHALEGFSDCLRLELAPLGIDVIIIEPGAIESAFGEVMLEPMLRRSGDGPYAELAHKFADVTRRSYAQSAASPASLIADVIAEALAAERPRTRYVAGKYARPMIALRKWLGDRAFDRILRSQL